MTPALKRREAAPSVDIQIASPLWDAQPLAEQTVRDAIAAAAAALSTAENGEVSIVLTDDEAIRALNRDWRGIDKPTNVLSFPAPATAGGEKMFGDIVIAYETLGRECHEGKTGFSCIIWPISRCMVFSTSSATITRPIPTPTRWKGSKARS